jgi:hypothetical protein
MEVDLDERELSHLHGYQGHGPVRIGNRAFTDDQHDVYGSVIAAMLPFFVDVRLFDAIKAPKLFAKLEKLGVNGVDMLCLASLCSLALFSCSFCVHFYRRCLKSSIMVVFRLLRAGESAVFVFNKPDAGIWVRETHESFLESSPYGNHARRRRMTSFRVFNCFAGAARMDAREHIQCGHVLVRS